MGLDIRLGPQAVGILADRRLYLDEARERLLEDGEAGAAYLLATPGWAIPAEDCVRLKLSLRDGKVVQGDNPKVKVTEVQSAEKPKRKKGG